jgi:hypothetical protein
MKASVRYFRAKYEISLGTLPMYSHKLTMQIYQYKNLHTLKHKKEIQNTINLVTIL